MAVMTCSVWNLPDYSTRFDHIIFRHGNLAVGVFSWTPIPTRISIAGVWHSVLSYQIAFRYLIGCSTCGLFREYHLPHWIWFNQDNSTCEHVLGIGLVSRSYWTFLLGVSQHSHQIYSCQWNQWHVIWSFSISERYISSLPTATTPGAAWLE